MGTCGFGDPGGNPDVGNHVLDGETEEVAMRRLNKSNSRIPKVEPSKDWGLICGLVLAMLALVSMLVYLMGGGK